MTKSYSIGSMLLLVLAITCSLSHAQSQQKISISVTADQASWKYELGQQAAFNIAVVNEDQTQVGDRMISYELSYDVMPPFKTGRVKLQEGKFQLKNLTMNQPGFLRCRVIAENGSEVYEEIGTIAFASDQIKPATIMPADFTQFWSEAIQKNKAIPLDTTVRLLEDRSTPTVNVYEISFQNYQENSRIYGILSVPRKPGKYPALLHVPPAGVRPYPPDLKNAGQGLITLVIGIHGIPVTMPREVYKDLYLGGLHRYGYQGWGHKDGVYYKRVFLGCVKAVDYIFSLPEFDGSNIIVSGGSQGGALALVTGALDNRIKGIVSNKPLLCDLAGGLYGGISGPPNVLDPLHYAPEVLKSREKVSRYYDMVNFVQMIRVPVYMAIGYNDSICPPTTIMAAYNTLDTEKQLLELPQMHHKQNPRQLQDAISQWIRDWQHNL